MSFFNDDPFEDIVNQFFGNHSGTKRRSRVRLKDDEEQNTQFIEEENYVYYIIELPGYQEKDIKVGIQENTLVVSAQAVNNSETQNYLAQKHQEGITIQQVIPAYVKTKNFSKTFKNGVLEVTFAKR